MATTDRQLTQRNGSLPDLVALLREQHAAKLDVVVPAAGIRSSVGCWQIDGTGEAFLGPDGVTTTPGTFVPTGTCDAGMADKLGIPVGCLRRREQTVLVLVLSRTQTESLLDLDALRRALRTAMEDVSAGRGSIPPRIAAMAADGGLLAAMPAYLPTGGLAAKLVSLFPGNAGSSLPTHQAVIVVFDVDCGRPVALIDGTSITTLRTAAGSALSAELLAREDAATLAILGTGVQARAHAEAMVRVRPIRRIRVAGRNREHTASLSSALRDSLGLPVETADTFAEACADADLICAATHSPDPVVCRDYLRPGVHVMSVGYNTAGREVDSATVVDAMVVVESRDAVLAPPPAGSNDLRTPMQQGLIGPEHIEAEVGELLLGTKPGRSSPAQITLYKSVGIAAQDVATAQLVLNAAREQNLGLEVDLSA